MHKHNLSKVIYIHEKEIILKKQHCLPCTAGHLCRFNNITMKLNNCLIIFLCNR